MFTINGVSGTTKLNNGVEMPYLGLGVWQTKDGQEVINAVHYALEAGYRAIDTAAIYKNEDGVGEAIRSSGVDRNEIFITTKVWNSDQGYDSTLKAFDASMKKLGLDHLDLYLVHWPVKGKYIDTYKALEKLYKEKRVRAIGVSNFLQHHLEDLMAHTEITPAVNQCEFHPHLMQQDLLDFCANHQIQYEAWSPLMQGKVFELDVLKQIADQYNKTIAQIVLRWDLQKGVVTIPKSVNQSRIQQNAGLFDFELRAEDMARLDALDQHLRVGPDPDNFDF